VDEKNRKDPKAPSDRFKVDGVDELVETDL
jgi:hypothetical protein